MIVDHFAARVTITFKQVQVHAVTVSELRSRLDSLQEFYLPATDGNGLRTADEATDADASDQ